MTKKEKMELLLSKIAEERKADFVAELREATTKEARKELLQKFNIQLSAEEKERNCYRSSTFSFQPKRRNQ